MRRKNSKPYMFSNPTRSLKTSGITKFSKDHNSLILFLRQRMFQSMSMPQRKTDWTARSHLQRGSSEQQSIRRRITLEFPNEFTVEILQPMTCLIPKRRYPSHHERTQPAHIVLTFVHDNVLPCIHLQDRRDVTTFSSKNTRPILRSPADIFYPSC